MIRVVAGLIEDDRGRLLACRRPEGKHLAGKWEFPGGKIEADESPSGALIRELQEELSIVVETSGSLTPVIHDYGRGPIELIPLRCRIIRGVPVAHEHSELRWCDAAGLSTLDLAEADLPILKEWLGTVG
jgi:8-oxo-dGTP diphosphatase